MKGNMLDKVVFCLFDKRIKTIYLEIYISLELISILIHRDYC